MSLFLMLSQPHTVDREIFAVKIFFRQLLRQRKLNMRKFLMCAFNFCHLATRQKLNARTFLTRKFPIYGIILAINFVLCIKLIHSSATNITN